MRVVVIGSGGREHAMTMALATADPKPELFVLPGNPGTAQLAKNIDSPKDIEGIVSTCRRIGADLVIVGPEQPLVDGLCDALDLEGITCCGPSAAAARLEASKAFTRELGARAGLPQPKFRVAHTAGELERAVCEFETPPVIKADGLAAGKGVLLPPTKEECISVGRGMLDGTMGKAGKTLVVEERLTGTEASLFFACAGEQWTALPHAQDFKRVGADDTGPNTGGMGAVSPNPRFDAAMVDAVGEELIAPTLKTLAKQDAPYFGFLYAGLMLTEDGPKLIEHNVRLGDPEAQVILPRLAPGAFLSLCLGIGQRDLPQSCEPLADPTCGVVVASRGYPAKAETDFEIELNQELASSERWLIHAGTKRDEDRLLTAGGRVATIVARGDSPEAARARAYEGVSLVTFEGMHYRPDIGAPT